MLVGSYTTRVPASNCQLLVYAQGMANFMAHHLNLRNHISNCKQETEKMNWGKKIKSYTAPNFSSEVLPPARQNLLNVPKQPTNWGQRIQTIKRVRGHLLYKPLHCPLMHSGVT